MSEIDLVADVLETIKVWKIREKKTGMFRGKWGWNVRGRTWTRESDLHQHIAVNYNSRYGPGVDDLEVVTFELMESELRPMQIVKDLITFRRRERLNKEQARRDKASKEHALDVLTAMGERYDRVS